MPVARSQPDDRASLEAWRLQLLLDAGYSKYRAAYLAGRPHVDHRLAISLKRRGCPERTAMRILL